MEHTIFHIKASPKQLSKLRNGHKVRISPAIEGKGFNLIVHPDRYSEISRTFNKGKGMEIQLTPEEIMVNQQSAPQMVGTGIFGKKFDRMVEKSLGKDAKKFIYKEAERLKPHLHKGIDTISKYAPEIGASALSGLALATGQPELLPVAGLIGSQLGSTIGKKGSAFAKDYLENPSTYQNQSNIGGPRSILSPSTLLGQVNQNDLLNNLNDQLGTNFGKLAQANMLNALAHMDRSKMGTAQISLLHKLGDAGITGQGLKDYVKTRRQVGIVGRGSGLVASQSHLPPALQSQPFSANFQFQHTLPPAYQKFSRGAGLYA